MDDAQRRLEQAKLATLLTVEGMTGLELLEFCVGDSVAPAICMNDGCDYTVAMEPDQDVGYCEECGTGSMKSALILMGMV